MARSNGLDNLSYADLLTLQEKIAAAIIARNFEDAKATKDQLRAYAEKAGFKLEELSESVVPKALASLSTATPRMRRRPGRAAVVSPTGLSMP